MADAPLTIRRARAEDLPSVRRLVDAYVNEFWDRPYPPPAWTDEQLASEDVLIAEEDGHDVGIALGSARAGVGHIAFVYVVSERRRSGIGGRLLAELAGSFHDAGVEHVTLDVDTSNTGAVAVWRRLGFAEYALKFTVPLAALRERLGRESEPSFGSVHVQTDDQGTVERAVERFVPRVSPSRATVVSPPRNGWVAVYDEVADREPAELRRLGAELSNVTGSVVVTLGVEAGQIVRYIAIDHGRIVDEYLSVPEYYGGLAPGDVVALRANPTVMSRLTGADPDAVRRVARVAAAPTELPPAHQHVAELARLFGIEGAEHGFDEARETDGARLIRHR
jgi:ribosomal protein S18 acetylase RimI-like enzyme